MKNKISIVLSLIIILSLFPITTNAKNFKDTKNHWAKNSISFLANKEIIKGVSEENFNPNQPIQRQHVVLMLNRHLKLNSSNRKNPNFSDVSKQHIYYDIIAAFAEEGIVTGYKGKFKPKDTITRAEMASILHRVFNLKIKNDIQFSDVPKNFWANNSIQSLASNGITVGYNNNQFKPYAPITRAEFAVFMNRILQPELRQPIEIIPTPLNKVGDIIKLNSEEILSYNIIQPKITEENFKLIRVNNPEQITEEGTHYKDTTKGNVRFLIHNQNALNQPNKIYLIARNETNEEQNIKLNKLGIVGPSPYPTFTGKESVAKYLTSKSSNKTINLKPNEAKIISTELSDIAIPNKQGITVNLDVYSNDSITYEVIILAENNKINLQKKYPQVKKANKHTRGTFENGNRHLNIQSKLGSINSRLIIGDGKYDNYIIGLDKISNEQEVNFGNRGVFYTINLEDVEPYTNIILNSRGGHYSGAFKVNGKLIYALEKGLLKNNQQGLIFYQTTNKNEKVKIEFIPASGSNLPINLVFQNWNN